MGTEFRVREITVSGSFKNWSDARNINGGLSGGSEFTLTAIPAEDRESWSPTEAQVVSFDLRMQIHQILMADAQNRGVPLPPNVQTTLIRYREKVESLKARAPGHLDWKDADVPPPVGDEVSSS